MEPPQPIYNQSATHFALALYLRGQTEVDGRLIADLAELYLSNLLFPGAFISREQTTERMRGMLGYFYRERPPVR